METFVILLKLEMDHKINQNYCAKMKDPMEEALSNIAAGKLMIIKSNLDALEKHEMAFYHTQKNYLTNKIDELHFLLSELINQEKFFKDWGNSHAEYIDGFIRKHTSTNEAIQNWKEQGDSELVKLNNAVKSNFEPIVGVINNQIVWLISAISEAERNVSFIIEAFTQLTNLIMDMKKSIIIADNDLNEDDYFPA